MSAIVTVYLLRRRGYNGFDRLPVPEVTALGTVRAIGWRGPLRFKKIRLHSGRHTFEWTYNLHLKCGHTKLIMQRRLASWTTHARCGKCDRS